MEIREMDELVVFLAGNRFSTIDLSGFSRNFLIPMFNRPPQLARSELPSILFILSVKRTYLTYPTDFGQYSCLQEFSASFQYQRFDQPDLLTHVLRMLRSPCALRILRLTFHVPTPEVGVMRERFCVTDDIDGLLCTEPFRSLTRVELNFRSRRQTFPPPPVDPDNRRQVEDCFPRCRERGILNVTVEY